MRACFLDVEKSLVREEKYIQSWILRGRIVKRQLGTCSGWTEDPSGHVFGGFAS
ncbi:hypothetical protein OS493_020794, partial [Desmophyllum pertusum]